MFKEEDFITNRNREGNEEYPTWKDLTEGYINMLSKKVDALQAELKLGIDLKLHQVENSMEIIKQDINDLRRLGFNFTKQKVYYLLVLSINFTFYFSSKQI